MISFDVKAEGLEQLRKVLDRETFWAAHDRILERTAQAIRSEVSALSPRRTGRLMNSWVYAKLGGHSYVVGTNVYYAPFVEFGTRPHTIYPRRARALRFEVDGEVVFARRVKHPGTPPQRILAKAVNLVQRQFKKFAGNILTDFTRGGRA